MNIHPDPYALANAFRPPTETEKRLTGAYSWTSAHPKRTMDLEAASRLYAALRGKLRVVNASGHYLPEKSRGFGSNDIEAWPLSYRLKSSSVMQPVCVTWRPKSNYRKATFAEFLNAYNIQIT